MKLAREQAKAYKDELVNKYYSRKITWAKYSELWDAIELLPLDLSAFPTLKSETIEWINKLFLEPPETNSRGNYMLRGFTRVEGAEMRLLGLTYGDYADAISYYAYNDSELIIYTFTEGDTTLQLFPDKESYEREKQSMMEWYKKERCA